MYELADPKSTYAHDREHRRNLLRKEWQSAIAHQNKLLYDRVCRAMDVAIDNAIDTSFEQYNEIKALISADVKAEIPDEDQARTLFSGLISETDLAKHAADRLVAKLNQKLNAHTLSIFLDAAGVSPIRVAPDADDAGKVGNGDDRRETEDRCASEIIVNNTSTRRTRASDDCESSPQAKRTRHSHGRGIGNEKKDIERERQNPNSKLPPIHYRRAQEKGASAVSSGGPGTDDPRMPVADMHPELPVPELSQGINGTGANAEPEDNEWFLVEQSAATNGAQSPTANPAQGPVATTHQPVVGSLPPEVQPAILPAFDPANYVILYIGPPPAPLRGHHCLPQGAILPVVLQGQPLEVPPLTYAAVYPSDPPVQLPCA
ncbi:hypothetical protein C8A03DRAFT_33517 [Achaetomium macrosporum]|uniref:Uncharacterized protein n=1 Tax=Achaetomium macrosporum TaxID=79813 RepID=A0AAN7CBJ0_9PEZI|nr:hypothetical protein C8A03DRAFT_33517 [Achaetomium macrosporum]